MLLYFALGIMCESIQAASIPPRANPGHLLHNGGWVFDNSVPAPGHLQTIKNLIVL